MEYLLNYFTTFLPPTQPPAQDGIQSIIYLMTMALGLIADSKSMSSLNYGNALTINYFNFPLFGNDLFG
jgi:hypothetical protein